MSDRRRHSGDGGRTSLADGTPVAKDSPSVEACGTFDELDSFAGLARVFVMEDIAESDMRHLLIRGLGLVQETAWMIGFSPANPTAERLGDPRELISRVEELCVEIENAAGPVRGFVLPGISRSEAILHVCRTVCRRAERRTVSVGSDSAEWQVPLANRLSSLLFASSRLAQKAAGKEPVYRDGPLARQRG